LERKTILRTNNFLGKEDGIQVNPKVTKTPVLPSSLSMVKLPLGEIV
jgi:hypothetical protein